MSKRLAGKRWFEAMGRRDAALGYKVSPQMEGLLPGWAVSAYVTGHVDQQRKRIAKIARAQKESS